jgi:ribosomal protein S8
MKEAVARVLLAEGYVRDVVTAGQGATKTLTVLLRYSEGRRAAITGVPPHQPSGHARLLRATEAPGRSARDSASAFYRLRTGCCDREARRRNVGGEGRVRGSGDVSRLGKVPIPLPDKVKVSVRTARVNRRGPKGKLSEELLNAASA